MRLPSEQLDVAEDLLTVDAIEHIVNEFDDVQQQCRLEGDYVT